MKKKLTLKRETIRGLNDAALGLAVGGTTSDNPFSNSCFSGEDGSCNGGCWWRRRIIE